MSKSRPTRSERLNQTLDKIEELAEEIAFLHDEIGDWKEKLEGTNLENTQKYTDLEECESALDELQQNFEDAINAGREIQFPSAR